MSSMKVRVEVEMLPMVVTLFLALGGSDGLVIDKCQLGDELNSTLPAILLDQITDLVAKIVCHVELSSGFNTNAINYVSGPNIRSFIRGHPGRRKGRSAESSSEESSEEGSTEIPQPGFSSLMVDPVTASQGNSSSSGEGRRRRSASDPSSEESSEEDVKSSSGEGRRRRSASEPSSEESSEEDVKSSIGERRRRRSASEPSSEESSEEDVKSSIGERRRRRSASEPSSEESSEEDVKSSIGERRRRSASESSSEESSEEDVKSSSGEERQRRSASEPSSEESSEEDVKSSIGERRRRSASEPSSEESRDRNVQVPKHNFNSSTVNPVTRPHGNKSFRGKSHIIRKSRSSETSSRESDERNTWTLYGLFQLPDHIACTSAFGPSLNLCSMACDSLFDDDIRDDITCVATILNKMLSAEKSQGPSKALFHKLYKAFFQKECSNVEDLKYFSSC